ncbi:MAG: hypothetical protein IJ679_13050 [Lachnospiraceae bacterium]|nr:hypothetical protein [Lachnospiraceae bacterium]
MDCTNTPFLISQADFPGAGLSGRYGEDLGDWFKIDEKEGEMDMCLAMERRYKKEQITGAINGMRIAGLDDETIIDKIIEAYNVTREYVLALLAPQTA